MTTISGTEQKRTGKILVPIPFVIIMVFFVSLITLSANFGPYIEGTVIAPINGIYT